MKLIKTDLYLLLIDEEAEIKEGKTFITKENIIHTVFGYNYGDRVVIAYYPLTKEAKELEGLLLLPPFEEQIDLHKLYNEKIRSYPFSYCNSDSYLGFRLGYEVALSKFQYSLEDMRNMFILGGKHKKQNPDSFLIKMEEILESLPTQQTYPKNFIPEYQRVRDWDNRDVNGDYNSKLVLKTITNSQGQKVVQGKYIY